MKKAAVPFLCLFLGILAGCGGDGDANPRPEEIEREFLTEIKTMSYGLQGESGSEVQGNLEILIENLDEAADEDLGEHEGTVDKLKTAAKELDSLYASKASGGKISTQISAIVALADTLPGDVNVDSTDGGAVTDEIDD